MFIDPREDEQRKHTLSRGEKIATVIIALAVIATLLLLGAKARAAEPACPWDADCLSFTVATQYTDDSPLPAASIAAHRIETAKSATGPWTVLTMLAMPATTYKRQPVSGTNYYRDVTVLVSGKESAPGLVGNVTTVEPTPNPPALLIVNNVGYQLNLGSNNRIYFSRVGTVPLNKPCIAGMNVMDKHVIQSRDWLTLDPTKTTRPRQVFAACATAF